MEPLFPCPLDPEISHPCLTKCFPGHPTPLPINAANGVQGSALNLARLPRPALPLPPPSRQLKDQKPNKQGDTRPRSESGLKKGCWQPASALQVSLEQAGQEKVRGQISLSSPFVQPGRHGTEGGPRGARRAPSLITTLREAITCLFPPPFLSLSGPRQEQPGRDGSAATQPVYLSRVKLAEWLLFLSLAQSYRGSEPSCEVVPPPPPPPFS